MTGNGADKSRWFSRFVASGIHGEVSDATIQGYLRSASQLEEIWQQIDDNVDNLMLQGMTPWDAYAKMGYALAFVRACRTNVVFVQELLKADAAADPASAGYLPRVTYDQALALSEHIEPYLEEAIKASTNPRYVSTTYFLPLQLGPRIKYANQRLPLPHLQGMIGAAQETREWAAGLLAKYELALGTAKTPPPQSVVTHLEEMKSELGLGDFHLRTGIDMVGQISRGQTTNELAEKSEDFLWEAMESFFKVSQLVAFSEMPARTPVRVSSVRGPEQRYAMHTTPDPQLHPAIPVQPPADAPDVSDLLNQVIAVPDAPRAAPAQPSPEMSNMLNSVIASSGTTQSSDEQPSPDASDLLEQLVRNTSAGASPAPTSEKPAHPPAQGANEADSAPQSPKAPSEDTVEGMLSEILGEQPTPTRLANEGAINRAPTARPEEKEHD